MNSEQKMDKGRVLNFVICYSLLVICYLLFGCNNPVEPVKTAVTVEPGYGTVSIQFPDWEGRTIFPAMYFTNYVYTFTRMLDGTPGGEPVSKEPDANGFFTLETGDWNVKVKAYVGEVADANLAATGEADFTLEPSPTKELTIYLAENESSGEPGIFACTIQYPPGTTVERFTMTKLPDMTEVILNSTPLSVGNGITRTKEDIPHGFYLLNIRLANNTERYKGIAGISEVVHIYPLQTTRYDKTFDGDNFSSIIVTYKFNDGTTPDLQEYHLYGKTATNADPERDGYVFGGWYLDDGSFLNKWNFNTLLTESITLYAEWKPIVIQFWVSMDGGEDEGFYSLKEALDYSITAAGDCYMVKIGENLAEIGADQSLAPYTFTGDGNRDITLIPKDKPVTVKLTGNGSLFTVNSGITLTLGTDVTLQGRNNNNASLIQVNAGGKLIMKTGSVITGNTGGGVYVHTGGTFTMEGGEISGVYMSGGTFNMKGGVSSGVSVSGGTFTMEGGVSSGVYVYTGGTFMMENGEISSGGVSVSGGTFTMKDGKISGNTGSGVSVSGGTFTMENGEIFGNTGSYGYGGGVYMSGGTFIMENGKIFENTGSGVYVSSGTFTMESGEISENTGSGVYTYGDFTLLSGKISENDGGGVYTYGTFTMKDGEISWNNGSGVYAYGTFTMKDGEIFKNTGYYAGGVHVSGTFIMKGGEIFENTASSIESDEISENTGYYAGGVYVSGGTFTMKDGEIFENTGSGVYVSDGTFSMEGGEISENKDGGVRVDAGTFTMEGGEISKNTTGTYGGGVYVYNEGSFIIRNGEISENEANYSGSGVRVRDGVLTMKGGKISENGKKMPSYSGGGVDMGEISYFTMEGGEISGNEANNGGGVHIGTNCIFTMIDGKISGNNDGGVFILGNFVMEGGEISGNTANYSGGGVYVYGTFTMSGGEISGNISRGVYVSGIFTKTGGIIYGYTYGDSKSNIVIDADSMVQNDQGHAVFAVSRGSLVVIKRKETTAGPTVYQMFDGSTGIWSGDWD